MGLPHVTEAPRRATFTYKTRNNTARPHNTHTHAGARQAHTQTHGHTLHTCGRAPGQSAGRAPFPPTATRAVASLDEAERLDGVVLFLEGLDVVVDSGAGRVGDLEAVDDLPLATIGGDGEAEV